MRQNKELGQVFLKDPKYIQRIVKAMDIEGRDVLEIGAGGGAMTSQLIGRTRRLWSVELDPRFAALLRKTYGGHDKFTVINKDILKVRLDSLAENLIVFGNVPYYISYQLITYVIEQRLVIEKVFMTLQKEFAAKLCASTGEKSYSFMSCYFQCFARARVLFEIPARAFLPRPKVDSAFTEIDFLAAPACALEDEEALFKLIKTAFSQRRKKLLNSLGGRYGRKTVHAMCEYASVPESSRAEHVSVDQYVKMLACFHSLKQG